MPTIKQLFSEIFNHDFEWRKEEGISELSNDLRKVKLLIGGWCSGYDAKGSDMMSLSYFCNAKEKVQEGWTVYQVMVFADCVGMYSMNDVMKTMKYCVKPSDARELETGGDPPMYVYVPFSELELIKAFEAYDFKELEDYDQCGFHNDFAAPGRVL